MDAQMLKNDWIKQVEPLLFSDDEPSLLGPNPPFPWDELALKIQEQFTLADLALQPQEFCWKDKSDLLSGMGDSPQTLYLHFSPLKGTVSWTMPNKDIWSLFNWLLGEKATNADILNETLKEGFYKYLAIETVNQLEKMGILSGLSPQLIENPPSLEGPFLCLDVGIRNHHETIWGRLCLSSSFRKEWKHFRNLNSEISFFSTLGPKLELSINVEVGQAILSVKELAAIALGDLILLDHCGYDPDIKKGPVYLTFKGKKVFRGRLRSDHIKLSDHPIYFEEPNPMENEHSPDEHSDIIPDDDFSSFEEEEDQDDLFLEDEELVAALEEELGPLEPQDKPEEMQEPEVTPEAVAEEPSEEKTIFAPNEIPLNVSIEIAHLRMSVQQLLELSPGNQLSLDKEPDNLVDLVVNGRCVGKGELIRMGDVLGVRVLQL